MVDARGLPITTDDVGLRTAESVRRKNVLGMPRVRPEVGYNSDPERVHEVLLAVVARPGSVTAGIGEPDST